MNNCNNCSVSTWCLAYGKCMAEEDGTNKILNQEELTSLYKFLETQYLPYDDLLLHETVRKLGKLVSPAT